MPCDPHRNRLVAYLYDEVKDEDAAALRDHLASCDGCREELDRLTSARALLREAAPDVPGFQPRVVVLAPRPAYRVALGFAAGLACAALLVASGFAFGRQSLPGAAGPVEVADSPGVERPVPTGLLEGDPARLDAIQAVVDRRLDERWNYYQRSTPTPVTVTPDQLDMALRQLENKVGSWRTSDVSYLLNAIAATEERTGARIGENRDALRYVLLANDPRFSEQ